MERLLAVAEVALQARAFLPLAHVAHHVPPLLGQVVHPVDGDVFVLVLRVRFGVLASSVKAVLGFSQVKQRRRARRLEGGEGRLCSPTRKHQEHWQPCPTHWREISVPCTPMANARLHSTGLC
jgi:hypothetical protein